ncbi:MAG: sigma-70 family RNA polymerase sigma factor [Planctomycetes bacterium]|nr:sigma-70 family RNA polymerase sigma factor [Planctomycetota bacterium]
MHVRRAVGGDATSLTWVVERFTPLLRAQAAYRLGSGLTRFVDAEDLVQDVWVRTLPKLGDLSPRDERLAPVLVRYLGVTLLRRLKDLVDRHLTGKPAVGEVSVGELAIDRSGVVTRAMRREDHHELQRRLDALDPRDREILVLRGIEQRGNGEVAALLGVPANPAAVRYRRALEKLRDLWPLPAGGDLAG